MTATLSFNLDDPQDVERHYKAVMAQEAFIALYSIFEELRRMDKEEREFTLQDVRERLWSKVPSSIEDSIY